MQNGLERYLTTDEQQMMSRLDSPVRIQAFLDGIPYSSEDLNRTPLQVLRERTAHCYDGALFAAAALNRIGHPPVLVDLLPQPGADDDHVLAIFRQEGLIGAIAKSNFAGLRFREPIHRTLRELALSYFEDFFNVKGQKTLRAYSVPFDLGRFQLARSPSSPSGQRQARPSEQVVGTEFGNAAEWMWDAEAVQAVERRLYRLRRIPLLPAGAAARLSPVDERSYAAGMMGADPAGLYVPKSEAPAGHPLRTGSAEGKPSSGRSSSDG